LNERFYEEEEDAYQRPGLLYRLVNSLNELAHKHRLAVVLTNQVPVKVVTEEAFNPSVMSLYLLYLFIADRTVKIHLLAFPVTVDFGIKKNWKWISRRCMNSTGTGTMEEL
jgi:Rad51